MNHLQPYEIRLVIQADTTVSTSEPTYEAHWQNSAGQPVTQPFTFQPVLTLDNLKELRWYLEEFLQFPGAGDRRRADIIVPKLRIWGQALYDAAFSTLQAQQIAVHLQEAESRGHLCQITIGCDVPLILQQPWELLHDARGPLTFRGVIVRRQLPESQDRQPPLFAPPLRVLLIVSRPEDVGFIDPRNSIRPLLEAISALPTGLVQIDFCEPPTVAHLEELIDQARRQNQPYHIVHFDGHGTYLQHTGVGALVFENDRAEHALVTGRQFGDLLSRLQVPLVILEACRSADLSDRPPHDSVAPALLQAGVGSVIAFSHSVHIEATKLLVACFYHELADGRTVGQALNEARVRLYTKPQRWLAVGPDAETIDLIDWFIPQLYQVGPDPALLAGFVTPTGDIPVFRPLDIGQLHGFPPSPRYQFQGRALELLRLERDFRQVPAVLLTGMGGMGKTALAREAAAWWLRTGRFAEAVFVSLEGRPLAERVVQMIGQALDGDAFSVRSTDEQWQWVVQSFHTRKLLVVWDNAESVLPQFQAGLVDDLLRYSADDLARLRLLYTDLTGHNSQGRLLITCRPAALEWPALKVRTLHGLSRADSLYVLRTVLERHAEARPPEYERAELDGLLNLLDDHPLSLELVGPHLLRRTPATIRAEFGRLLAEFTSDTPEEERNRSLRASLAFSLHHLSESARAHLPWLAWFSGGVMEDVLLAFVGLTPDALYAFRTELVDLALVRLEDITGFTAPYWHLHPTLPYAATPEEVPDPEGVELRFILLYVKVVLEAARALHGSHSIVGVMLLRQEEVNCRTALVRAFHRGEQETSAAIAGALNDYLIMEGRPRERDQLVRWVRNRLGNDRQLDATVCGSIRDHAWTLCRQGDATQAVQTLQELLNRLDKEGVVDKATSMHERAQTLTSLGKVFHHNGRYDLAVEPLQQAVSLFEQLGDGDQANLAVTLDTLASTLQELGHLREALVWIDQSLVILRRLDMIRNIAVGLVQRAIILRDLERYREADMCYDEALNKARRAGDRYTEGTIFQHKGTLQSRMGNNDEAVRFYQGAMRLYQDAGDQNAEMETSNLLGTAEMQRNNLDAAEAWFEHTRELAMRLNDRRHLGIVYQNLGVLYEIRGEQDNDLRRRTAYLHQALSSIQESLQIWQETGHQVNEATSLSRSGNLYHHLGDLAQAETYLMQARGIYEALDHPHLSRLYSDLAQVAYARKDLSAAAHWEIQAQAKGAALIRQRGSGGHMPPLVRFEPMLRAFAAAADKEAAQRAELDTLLPLLEEKGWRIADATRRIWIGERDLATLLADMDIISLAPVARILQFVANPDTSPLLVEETPPTAHA